MDGLDLFAVIWFIHNLAGILDSIFLRTEPSRDIIDVWNLNFSLLQVAQTYCGAESNNPYAGVGSFHSRYHYLEGGSSSVSEEVYLE